VKRNIVVTLAVVLAATASAAFGAEGEGRGVQVFGTVDYYGAGDIDEDVEDNYNRLLDLAGNGRNDISTSNGIGARLGVRTTIADGAFDVGASAGYVLGPEIEAEFESFSPVARTEETIKTEFIRVLVEIGGRIWVSDTVAIRLGGGVGLGQSKMTDDFSATGVASRSREEKETGVTWELSPAMLIQRGKMDIEIGARYAQFPKIEKTNDTYEIDWTPFGFYVGLAF
jgi:hypothetical protein